MIIEVFFFRIKLFFSKKKPDPLGIKWYAPYELLGDIQGPRNYCNKCLSFHTCQENVSLKKILNVIDSEHT